MARGGGRHFSRDLDPRFSQPVESSSSEEESEDESSDGEDEVDAKLAPSMAAVNLKLGNTVAADGPDEDNMTRAERKALKKKQADEAAQRKAAKLAAGEESSSEEDSDDELLNPWKNRGPSRREK